jgi:DNA-binding response OmpR family regulator
LAEFHHQRKALPGARSGAAPQARILVVDDNDDVRQMMAVALQTQGHSVEEAADAGEALRHLQNGSFDVVLTDYELPDKTGATMLREAVASGLLGNATALIVTAHTAPEDVEGFDVIHKPINLDHLMAQVRGVLKSSAASFTPPAAADGGTEAVDIVLYVAAGSAASATARRSMENILRQFVGCPIRYTVCDVAEDTANAEEDQIVFAPTLVKRSPGPRTWVLGDLADAAVVVDLLKMCGMKPST